MKPHLPPLPTGRHGEVTIFDALGMTSESIAALRTLADQVKAASVRSSLKMAGVIKPAKKSA